MTIQLWIVVGISVLAVLIFLVAMRSLLRENREIDKKIDYSKFRAIDDDEDD